MAGRASRVCAWCGTSDGLPSEEADITTHGLCHRCLSERMAESPELGDEADDASEDPELAVATGSRATFVSVR